MGYIKHIISMLFSIDIRSRLIVGFLVATCLTGMVATVVGIRLINENTIREAQRKVQQDINTARLIFNYNMDRLRSQVQCISQSCSFQDDLYTKKDVSAENLKASIKSAVSLPERCSCLDMLTLVDAGGTVVFRGSNPAAVGDNMLWDTVVRKCLQEGKVQSAPELIPVSLILLENPDLSERVDTPIIQTPQSVELAPERLPDGMVLRVAHPLFNGKGDLIGALVGGTLLNKDYTIVDKIRETVYHDETYRGLDVGFATIFQGSVRISTNVMNENNERAIGTIVSREVYDKVITRGEDWIGRAFVVDDWYLSSYSPIYDMNRNIIGMLYTGILEAKYRDMKLITMMIFLGITFAGMIIAFFISYFFGHSIIQRIQVLKGATDRIASGDLNYQLPRGKFSGFDILDDAFDNMARSLRDRDDRLQKVFKQLTRTERLAALGQIAAGVAHEINNPLGGILLYSNLVYEELPEANRARANIEKIIYQTNRCKQIVQNLLDFARTPAGELMPFNVNDVIQTSLALVEDQSMFQSVEVVKNLDGNLPDIKGDRSRLEQVFLNLFINAADAMNGKGTITISSQVLTRYAGDTEDVSFHDEKICLLGSDQTVKITISDTGRGIDKAYLPHIFEPFFTTKDPGQGTGLGLSITYGIIQSHGGFIDVESEPGVGTSFIIALPAYRETDPSGSLTQEGTTDR
ncbi:MAG: cache domain-containing protein [Deltaproteobacteria bacterium]|nr:cache domain-containing protein [Deltaproteobacteria bacterium]